MVGLLPSNKIHLAKSCTPNAGRGVFATVAIRKDEVIEKCPVIEIPEREVALLRKSQLKNYYFMWGKKLKMVAICLGFGSLYNHSYEPNATYIKRMEEKVIHFIALRDIKKDEEITVNYNFGNPDDKSPLWIKAIKPAV